MDFAVQLEGDKADTTETVMDSLFPPLAPYIHGMQVNVIKGDKEAEDWDHEANAADDDEDMGEHDDPGNRDASPPPRQ